MMRGELLVGVELGRVRSPLLERVLSLLDGARVAGAVIGTHRIEKERDAIEQGSTERGAAAHQNQIAGMKNHDRCANRIRCELRHAFAIERKRTAPVADRSYLLAREPTFSNAAKDARGVGAVLDDLAGFFGSKALAGRDYVERFEQARLAVAVRARDDIPAGCGIELDVFEISKVPNRDVLEAELGRVRDHAIQIRIGMTTAR